MRWFKVVRNDRVTPDPLVTDDADLAGVDPESLDIGVPAPRWDPEAVLRAVKPENDGWPDDALQNNLCLLVFSGRLRAALEAEGIRGIQFLPVRVLRPGGEPVEGYSVANVVALRDALDRGLSDYSVYPDDYFLPERRGRVRAVRITVLRRAALAGTDLIRLADSRASVYASERFRQVFDEDSCTGLSFREVRVVD